MQIDPNIKIKNGKVINVPDKYRELYYFDKNGALKIKKISKKEAIARINYYINTRSYLFHEEKKENIDVKKISRIFNV